MEGHSGNTKTKLPSTRTGYLGTAYRGISNRTWTLTSFSIASPLSRNGSYFQRLTASAAAAFNKGCPLTIFTSVTVPFLAMWAVMTTMPLRCSERAAEGYSGDTFTSCFPPVTPWLTGVRTSVGAETGVESRLAMVCEFAGAMAAGGATGCDSGVRVRPLPELTSNGASVFCAAPVDDAGVDGAAFGASVFLAGVVGFGTAPAVGCVEAGTALADVGNATGVVVGDVVAGAAFAACTAGADGDELV